MPSLRQQIRDYYDAQKLSDAKVDLILSVTEPTPGPISTKVVEFPRALIMRRMAMAAAVLLCAMLAFQFGTRRPKLIPFAVIAPRIIEIFHAPHPLNQSQDKAALREWLLAHGAPADFQIPAKLAVLKSVGCTVVDVQGKPAYLTCFWREPGPGATKRELIHLLAVRRSDFRDGPAGPIPQLREMEGWSFASWAAGDIIYTMATPAPLEKLRPFLVGEPRRSSALAAEGRAPARPGERSEVVCERGTIFMPLADLDRGSASLRGFYGLIRSSSAISEPVVSASSVTG